MSTNPRNLHDVQPDGFFTRGLAEADPAVFGGVQHELKREQTQIELIATENIVSKAVLAGPGLGLHQQICRGLSGQALLSGLRTLRRGRDASRSSAPRSCSIAVSPTSSRIRARRRTAR